MPRQTRRDGLITRHWQPLVARTACTEMTG